MLRLLTFSGTHPLIADGDTLLTPSRSSTSCSTAPSPDQPRRQPDADPAPARATCGRTSGGCGARRPAAVRRRRSPRSTCPASTPTSSTTASSRATPATSCASAAVMLAVTLRPDRLLDRRRLLRRAGPRWRSAATCGPRSSTGCRTFSAREVGQFGAPSLITRTTNDVQQVQMLVLMTFTHDGRRADHVRRRHRHGAARGRRAVVAAAGRACRCWSSVVGLIIVRMRPLFRRMQERIDRSTGCCASRSPASGWSARSSATGTRRERFGGANAELTDVVAAASAG